MRPARIAKNPLTAATAGMHGGLAVGLLLGVVLMKLTHLQALSSLLLGLACCLLVAHIEKELNVAYGICFTASFSFVFSLVSGQFSEHVSLAISGVILYTLLFFAIVVMERKWRAMHP